MWQLIALAALQSLMLATGQLALKIALGSMAPFAWSLRFWGSLLTNIPFALAGVMFGGASLLWIYILKHYPLSMAAPLGSMAYMFAVILAVVVLHEPAAWNRWLGVALVMAGCALITAR